MAAADVKRAATKMLERADWRRRGVAALSMTDTRTLLSGLRPLASGKWCHESRFGVCSRCSHCNSGAGLFAVAKRKPRAVSRSGSSTAHLAGPYAGASGRVSICLGAMFREEANYPPFDEKPRVNMSQSASRDARRAEKCLVIYQFGRFAGQARCLAAWMDRGGAAASKRTAQPMCRHLRAWMPKADSPRASGNNGALAVSSTLSVVSAVKNIRSICKTSLLRRPPQKPERTTCRRPSPRS